MAEEQKKLIPKEKSMEISKNNNIDVSITNNDFTQDNINNINQSLV